MEGIRDSLDDIYKDAPDLLDNRQFHKCLRHIPVYSTDGLVRLIPFDVSEDIVLQHAERDGCNLGREVATLAFTKVQKPLGFSERDLNGPAHRVYFVRLIRSKGGICGKQRIPFALLAVAIEKVFDGGSGKGCPPPTSFRADSPPFLIPGPRDGRRGEEIAGQARDEEG